MWKLSDLYRSGKMGIGVALGSERTSTRAWLICVGLISLIQLGWNGESAEAQAVPGAQYQVRVSDYYGQLKTSGYTPLRFTITRFGTAVNSAETLYAGVAISGIAYNGRREISARVELKEGQVSATVELNIPAGAGYLSTAVVSRDGSTNSIPRPGLIASVPLPDWLSAPNWRGSNTAITDSLSVAYFSSKMAVDTGVHLDAFWHPDWRNPFVSSTGPTVAATMAQPLPNIKELIAVTGNEANRLVHDNLPVPTVTDPQLTAVIGNRFVIAGDFSAIPSTWLGLSRVDVCLISVTDLSSLANQQPDKLEVIRQWVVAGGRLVVLDCQADYSGLGSIIPNLISAAKPALEPAASQWSILADDSADLLSAVYEQNVENWRGEILDQNAQPSWQATTYDNPITAWITAHNLNRKIKTLTGTPGKIADEVAAAQARLVFGTYGTGRLVAVPSDGSQLAKQDWLENLVAIYGNQETTCFDGISDSNHAFAGYMDFDYKRLGKPPWMLFLVLITTFAITVGPIAFIILRRTGRTHLLLGVVPSIAFVITSGIIGFAMIQDGLAFRTSRLSITWLDTRNQAALTQTSQMVYSGIAPGSFQFPLSTAYYDNSAESGRHRNNELRIFLQGDRQNISGTHVQARTKLQVTTFDVNTAQGQLLLSATPDGGTWNVTNQLGFSLELLVVETPLGQMTAENVEDGTSAVLGLDPNPRRAWINRFRSRELEGMAAIPELFRDEGRWSSTSGRLSQATSMFYSPSNLPRGSFVAISREQPLARSLREQTYQDEELHVTIGQYTATTPLPEAVPGAEQPSPAADETPENGDEHPHGAGEDQP
jgi:hypothetical protein